MTTSYRPGTNVTYFHLDEDQALHITPTTETNLDT